jgi:DNA-binding beta-propeller fold protein YncE
MSPRRPLPLLPGPARTAGRVQRKCLLATAAAVAWLCVASAPALATSGYGPSGHFTTTGGDAQAIAVDPATRQFYVATFVSEGFDPGAIERFSSTAGPLNTFGSAYFTGVAVDPLNHDVYAYDSQHQSIDAFDSAGDPVDVFEEGTTSTLVLTGGEFAAVRIATDAAGDIYYPNQALGELQQFHPDGTPGLTIADLTGPSDVAVAPDGTIYVLDTNASSGEPQLQQFEPTGAPTGTGVFAAGGLSRPRAAGVDAGGDVFVLDDTPDGTVVDELDSSGGRLRTFAAGLLHEADSIAVDPSSGAVYVLQNEGFSSPGSVSLFTPSTITPPAAATGQATGIDPGDELVTGTVNPEGTDTTYRFDYGRTQAFGRAAPPTDTDAGHGAADAQAIAVIAGLEPNQTYRYRVVATNAEGDRTYGADEAFTTQPARPAVSGETASATTQTGTTLEAQINPNNQPTSYYFEYATSPTLSGASAVPAPPGTEIGGGFGDQTAAQDIGGLAPNTSYYYRTIAVNATGTTDGPIERFSTLPLAPGVTTGPASAITQTSATLNGTLTTRDSQTTYRFEYVSDAEFRSGGYELAKTAPQPEGSEPAFTEPAAVAVAVEGLEPDTTYHVRLLASNAGGASEAGEVTFTTPILPPAVSTGFPVTLDPTAATVQAGVNPEGGAADYFFEYGPTTSYGASTAVARVAASLESQPVLATLAGLAPGATYHYRVLASNSSGTTRGRDESFTTPAEGVAAAAASPFGIGTSLALPGATYGVLSGLAPTPPSKNAGEPQPTTRDQKLAAALRACRKAKRRARRSRCERRARRRYGHQRPR